MSHISALFEDKVLTKIIDWVNCKERTVKIFSFEDFSAPLFYNLEIMKAMDLISEAATGGILLKMVVLKFSQISQENSSVGEHLKNICERLLFKIVFLLKYPFM